MNVMPVIVRELRAGARQPMNYWSRVLGAAVVIIVFAVMLIGHQGSPAALGAKLFTSLHTAIFVAIWAFVPAMTADCIAREKREGTLGLLFLTPLTPAGIVVGKSLVHLLRAMTLWLSALPVMAVPLLLGGVTWLDIYTAFTFEFCAVIMALSAGLLASSLSKVWGRAVLAAEFISLMFAVLAGWFLVLMFGILIAQTTPNFRWQELWTFQALFAGPVILSTGVLGGSWSQLFAMGGPPGIRQFWVWMVGGTLVFCLLVFGLTVLLAARRIKQSWQDEPLSPRKLWWFKKFTTPLFWQAQHRRKLRRTLERNPIAWLHQRTWVTRVGQWGCCFLILFIDIILFAGGGILLVIEWQFWLLVGLALTLAFYAASRFSAERETGALELILVTPITPGKIIAGGLRGLWGQFAPASLLLVISWGVAWFQARAEFGGARLPLEVWIFFYPALVASTFLCLPFIGLSFSLALKNQFMAWLATCVAGILFPVGLAALGDTITSGGIYYSTVGGERAAMYVIVLEQFIMALIAWLFLRLNFTRRTFALDERRR